jgi:hypothetical protein
MMLSESFSDALFLVINFPALQMETLTAQYSVPLAVVDGKSLADLAQGVVETEHQPQIQVRFSVWVSMNPLHTCLHLLRTNISI